MEFPQSWKSQGIGMEIPFNLQSASSSWAQDSMVDKRAGKKQQADLESWEGSFTALTQAD